MLNCRNVDPPVESMMINGEASDRIKLIAAPVIAVETTAAETAAVAAEVETALPAASPQTADAALFMSVTAVLSAAGIIFSKKRK